MISFKKYENDLNFVKNDTCQVEKVNMDYLPAFYFYSDAGTIDDILIICSDRSTFDSISLSFQTFDIDGGYIHIYEGGDSLDICGLYYFEIQSGTKKYYSELFSVESFTDIKLPFIYDIGVPAEDYTDLRDGETYQTVNIGNRNWMASPLRYRVRVENTDYREPFDITINPEYGLLYKYSTIKDREFIPLGWRLPNESDMYDLIVAAGGFSLAGHLKSALLWNAPNTGGDNSVGFNATPTGYYSSGMIGENQKNVIFCDSYVYPDKFRTYTLNYNSAEIDKTANFENDFVSVRLVRDLTYLEYYDRKDDLHLPIRFSEILEIDKDNPTVVNRSVMPIFLFKTINETSGAITINQVYWDGSVSYPITATINTIIIDGIRYYYSTAEDIELECGLYYFEMIDGDHTYYSNLLSFSELEFADQCVSILLTETEDIVETETGYIVALEVCEDTPYVPTLEAATDFDGEEFNDYDNEIFTIEI